MRKTRGSKRQLGQAAIREDKKQRIEVHVGTICFRPNENNSGPEILIAKRTETRELYPKKWECGGGQVFPGENFEEAVRRQVFEEFNLSVEVVGLIGTYEILTGDPDQSKIPGVKFLCLVNGKGEKVILNQREHSQYLWIRPDQIDRFDFISGIARDIREGLEIYDSLFPRNGGRRKIGYF